MKKKLIAGVLTLATAMSLTVPTFAEDVNKEAKADSTIVSVDLTDSLKLSQEYQETMLDPASVVEEINYHCTEYQDNKRDALIAGNPDLDIQIIDDFMSEIKSNNDEFIAKYEVLYQEYQSKGYLDPYAYSEHLAIIQHYNEKKYKQVADFVNTYATVLDEDATNFVLENLRNSSMSSSMMGYLQFHYGMYNEEAEQKAKIATAYDEVYQQVSEIESDPEEIKKMVADILEESVRAWIKEMDVDYFIAFQAQVELYLQNAKDCGYVWDLDNNHVAHSSIVDNSRELILADLAGFVGLHQHILEPNLNDDGTAFVSPEEAYNHADIQMLVESVMSTFTKDSPEYYEKDNIIETVWNAIGAEYSMMSMPGSTIQPITSFYPWMASNWLYEAYLNTGTMPILTSWFENGDSIPIYDQYRRENYIKVPSVQLREESTKEVTRTIHYVFEDGTKAAEDVVQTVEFTIVKGIISGKVTATPDNQTFAAVANPSVTHPDANVTVLDPETSAEALNIDPSAENSEITIVYPLEVKETETQTETQTETESETQTATESEQESQSNQETKDQTGSNTDVPKTGDESMTALFLILLAISAVGTVTLVYVKRKNMNI